MDTAYVGSHFGRVTVGTRAFNSFNVCDQTAHIGHVAKIPDWTVYSPRRAGSTYQLEPVPSISETVLSPDNQFEIRQ